jgi:hypothetical protein
MMSTVIELGLALLAIAAAGVVLIRIWDNQRGGRKGK